MAPCRGSLRSVSTKTSNTVSESSFISRPFSFDLSYSLEHEFMSFDIYKRGMACALVTNGGIATLLLDRINTNTVVELDRTWRRGECRSPMRSPWRSPLIPELFALSMNVFATRTPSLVAIQACVHSCSNLY